MLRLRITTLPLEGDFGTFRVSKPGLNNNLPATPLLCGDASGDSACKMLKGKYILK